MPRVRVPLVLCLSGLDPTGGAGVLADAQAVAAQGAHALGIVTANTVQDSRDVRRAEAVAPALIEQQLQALLDDCRPDALKIGLLGDAAQVPVIRRAIARCGVPVVLDPVLRAGGGADLVGAALVQAMAEELLPLVALITPNAAEARRLAPGAAGLDDCAARLLGRGCGYVLITGGDEAEDAARVRNRGYAPGAPVQTWEWPRLPETFHGAGCTLAAAVAARLALGEPMTLALERGQRWTQDTLQRAFAVGGGRRIPGRVAA